MEKLKMRVEKRRPLTEAICEFTLKPVDGASLPSFEPGAHVTVETPSGATRRYSLVNDGANPESYVIAVKRERESRGGSASMHDEAQEGTELQVEVPENTFALTDVAEYLLIAGGIGVTPIYAMAQELERQNKRFNIIYCTRSKEETAYLDEFVEAFGDRVLIHHDDGDPEKIYDFWDHFAEPRKTHVFCCGPKPLMEEIQAVSGHWPEGRVHFEDFKPVDVVRADDVEFEVELKKSGETVTVPANRSILEAIRDRGHKTVSSCESGTCGTCKTKLLGGEVDHRDMVLMDEEKGEFIMICVSRAKSGNLVLDL
ncbi:PDR/VanB family oxidoreductase [Jiella avicenniae]|uniref:PDR/VanB family oxidoreductase n=1 Tax=Jiella avicenniae TaxID=2907202 RepID=A0A9X1T678_9HYPH|nr:PDR/VanB family oxidoreductase [Jiella avicenniae]MCE7029952.1 PDR/VanB family oxidoreductase [Jiella avicenniae]